MSETKTQYRSKLKEYINNPILSDFFESRKNVSSKYSSTFTSAILSYLEWRNISLEELLKSGEKEKDYLKEFVEKATRPSTIPSRRSVASLVRRLLRFHKIEILIPETKRKEIWYYMNDPKMKDFIEIHLHSSKQTKKMINRAIADYSNFRKMTPSEIIEEDPSVKEIKRYLREFFVWRKEQVFSNVERKEITTKFVWHKILLIKRFYEEYLEILFVFKEHEKPVFDDNEKPQETITKEQMKELLSVADVRDSLIIYGLWESGLSPVDLTSITYGQIKEFLNIDDPDNVSDCAVFKHKRQKTKRKNNQFICVLGKQTLKYASLWLKQRTNGSLNYTEELTDSSFVFSKKRPPFNSSKNVPMQSLTRICKLLGLERVNPGVFRNTFETKLTETGMDYIIRKMFMGHNIGVTSHYAHFSTDYFKEQYLKYWTVCFDLTYDDEKMRSLEDEALKTRGELFNLRQTNAVLSSLVLRMIKADQENKAFIIDDDEFKALERAIKK